MKNKSLLKRNVPCATRGDCFHKSCSISGQNKFIVNRELCSFKILHVILHATKVNKIYLTSPEVDKCQWSGRVCILKLRYFLKFLCCVVSFAIRNSNEFHDWHNGSKNANKSRKLPHIAAVWISSQIHFSLLFAKNRIRVTLKQHRRLVQKLFSYWYFKIVFSLRSSFCILSGDGFGDRVGHFNRPGYLRSLFVWGLSRKWLVFEFSLWISIFSRFLWFPEYILGVPPFLG